MSENDGSEMVTVGDGLTAASGLTDSVLNSSDMDCSAIDDLVTPFTNLHFNQSTPQPLARPVSLACPPPTFLPCPTSALFPSVSSAFQPRSAGSSNVIRPLSAPTFLPTAPSSFTTVTSNPFHFANQLSSAFPTTNSSKNWKDSPSFSARPLVSSSSDFSFRVLTRSVSTGLNLNRETQPPLSSKPPLPRSRPPPLPPWHNNRHSTLSVASTPGSAGPLVPFSFNPAAVGALFTPSPLAPFNPTDSQPSNPAGSQPFNPTGSQPFNPTGSQHFNPTGSQHFNPTGSQPFNPAGSQSFTFTSPFFNTAPLPTGNPVRFDPVWSLSSSQAVTSPASGENAPLSAFANNPFQSGNTSTEVAAMSSSPTHAMTHLPLTPNTVQSTTCDPSFAMPSPPNHQLASSFPVLSSPLPFYTPSLCSGQAGSSTGSRGGFTSFKAFCHVDPTSCFAFSATGKATCEATGKATDGEATGEATKDHFPQAKTTLLSSDKSAFSSSLSSFVGFSVDVPSVSKSSPSAAPIPFSSSATHIGNSSLSRDFGVASLATDLCAQSVFSRPPHAAERSFAPLPELPVAKLHSMPNFLSFHTPARGHKTEALIPVTLVNPPPTKLGPWWMGPVNPAKPSLPLEKKFIDCGGTRGGAGVPPKKTVEENKKGPYDNQERFGPEVDGVTLKLGYSLFKHQQLAVAWILEREANEHWGIRGGLLCLGMGLGKTLVTLWVIAKKRACQRFPTLILCSKSLMSNWQNDRSKFFGSQLKGLFYHQDFMTKAEFQDMCLAQIQTFDFVVTSYDLICCTFRKHKDWIFHHLPSPTALLQFDNSNHVSSNVVPTLGKPRSAQTVLTPHLTLSTSKTKPSEDLNNQQAKDSGKSNSGPTTTTAGDSAKRNSWLSALETLRGPVLLFAIPWYRIVADESQSFANHTCSRLKTLLNLSSERKLCLTGTPIRNVETDVWSQFRFCNFTGVMEAKKWTTGAFSHFKLRENILMMDTKTAGIELPPKIEKLVHVALEAESKKIYKLFVRLCSMTLEGMEEGHSSFGALLANFTRLRQVCIAPYLIHPSSASLFGEDEEEEKEKEKEKEKDPGTTTEDTSKAKSLKKTKAKKSADKDQDQVVDEEQDAEDEQDEGLLGQTNPNENEMIPDDGTMWDESENDFLEMWKKLMGGSARDRENREMQELGSWLGEIDGSSGTGSQKFNAIVGLFADELKLTPTRTAQDDSFQKHDPIQPPNKVIVFSTFAKALRLLRRRLLNEGYPPDSIVLVDGSLKTASEREVLWQRFRSEPGCCVLLMTYKIGSEGVTLIQANYIILLEPWWCPAVKAQAVCRAWRIGQTRPVTIYNIMAVDTIEDRILEVGSEKDEICAHLFSAQQNQLAKVKAGGADWIKSLLA